MNPAKFAKNLIFRIIQHALDEGWVVKGQTCFDPFAGVALGSLPCNLLGLHWRGVELEERFVTLGRANLALWSRRFGAMPGYGTAQIVQGDSRRLLAVLKEPQPPQRCDVCANACEPCVLCAEGALVCSSPPFGQSDTRPTGLGIGKGTRETGHSADRNKGDYHYADSPANLGNLPVGSPPAGAELILTSPPYTGNQKSDYLLSADGKTRQRDEHRGYAQGHGCFRGSETYGQSDGQLGGLPTGTPPDVPPALVASSPPFGQSLQSGSEASKWALLEKCAQDGHGHAVGRHERSVGKDYGTTLGQLGAMRGADAIVTSPPYEASINNAQSGKGIDWTKTKREGDVSHQRLGNNKIVGAMQYGGSVGQLGTTQGDTFWEASRTILQQCYQLLPVGGHACFVLKMYVSGGRLIDFPAQWASLCESVGLRLLHHHKAMLVTEHGTELGLFGAEGDVTRQTKRRSFFRALAEKRRPDLAIDWESVLCFVKE